MRIGMISDIHDNIWALEGVLRGLADCDVLLCLGDLCSPFTLAAIAKGFAGPVHVVWGNNDGDRLLLARIAQQAGNVTLHGEFAELELGERHIVMTHYPQIAQALARGRSYALVCHGHDHQRRAEQVDGTWLVNPGEVMGRFGVTSYGVYDTERQHAEIVEL